MEDFPSDMELIAASALLLLSCEEFGSAPRSMSITEESKEEEEIEFERELEKKSDALGLSCLETSTEDTTPCASSLTSDESIQAHRIKLLDEAATRCHAIKIKVARRARSKVIYRSSVDRKPGPMIWENSKPKKVTESEITTTTTEGSCLSSGGSSEISSVESGSSRRKRELGERKRLRRGVGVGVDQGELKRRAVEVGSTHIRQRAEAIMKLLSGGCCASEVRIRQILGDSPDTSKALRLLLKMEEVKRTGLGGRSDPFIYKIAAETEA